MVEVLAIALHVAHERREAPRTDPAQPLRFERVRYGPIERERRHGTRAVAEDQAALPARAPPPVLRAGRDDPVAELAGEIRAVEAHGVVVVRVRHGGQFDAGTPALADEATGPAGDLALLAWLVVEGAQDARSGRGPELVTQGRATLGGQRAEPGDGGGMSGRQRVRAARGRHLGQRIRQVRRRDRPAGHRQVDHAVVDQQLDVEPRLDVARRDPGFPRGSGRAGQRNRKQGSDASFHRRDGNGSVTPRASAPSPRAAPARGADPPARPPAPLPAPSNPRASCRVRHPTGRTD